MKNTKKVVFYIDFYKLTFNLLINKSNWAYILLLLTIINYKNYYVIEVRFFQS